MNCSLLRSRTNWLIRFRRSAVDLSAHCTWRTEKRAVLKSSRWPLVDVVLVRSYLLVRVLFYTTRSCHMVFDFIFSFVIVCVVRSLEFLSSQNLFSRLLSAFLLLWLYRFWVILSELESRLFIMNSNQLLIQGWKQIFCSIENHQFLCSKTGWKTRPSIFTINYLSFPLHHEKLQLKIFRNVYVLVSVCVCICDREHNSDVSEFLVLSCWWSSRIFKTRDDDKKKIIIWYF